MNFLKRAFFSIKTYWPRWLLTFAIFTCAFFLVLTSFLMLEGARQSARSMKEEYRATVTVVDYDVRSPDRYDSNLISPQTVEAFRSHPLAESVTTFAYSSARSSAQLRPFAVEAQLEEYFATSFQVQATDNVQGAPDFAMHNYYLAEGDFFTPGQTSGVILSETVAEENGLGLGDTLTLPAYYDDRGGQDAEVVITGIYGIDAPGGYTEDPYFNSENLLYVTPDVGAKLNGENDHFYLVSCTVSDPEKAVEFVRAMQEAGLEEGEGLRFSIDDSRYRSVRSMIASVTKIAGAMLAAAIVVGCAVLILLTLISLKGREFEIGVLLSMGEDKWKIGAQLVLESLFPVVLSATAALCLTPFSRLCINQVFGGTWQSTALTPQMTGGLYLSAAVLTLAGSAVMGYKLWRYQPKRILGDVE